VFLGLAKKIKLKPKVAPYLKVPIVFDVLDIPNTKCNPYNNIYHMMNVAEKMVTELTFIKKLVR